MYQHNSIDCVILLAVYSLQMSAQTLREARGLAGLTQDQLAARSGVAQATISSLERGVRSNPTIDTVKRLAEALGVAPSSLRFSGPRLDRTVDPGDDRAGHGVEVSRRVS